MVLAQKCNFDKAIEVANGIPLRYIKGRALKSICEALTGNYNIDKAIEVANMVPDENAKEEALRDISLASMHKAVERYKKTSDQFLLAIKNIREMVR